MVVAACAGNNEQRDGVRVRISPPRMAEGHIGSVSPHNDAAGSRPAHFAHRVRGAAAFGTRSSDADDDVGVLGDVAVRARGGEAVVDVLDKNARWPHPRLGDSLERVPVWG